VELDVDHTLSAAFETACRRHNQSPAMVEGTGALVSFAGLFFTTLSFAETLAEHGIGPDSLVAVHVPDPIAAIALRLALLRIGATVLAVPRDFAPDAGFPDPLRHVVPLASSAGSDDEITVTPDWLRPPRKLLPISGRGVLVKSSSGTTGLPKLRQFSEPALLARVRWGADHRGVAEGPALVGYGPTSSPGFNHALRLIMDGRLQVHTQPTPEATLQLMDRLGVTTLYASPFNFQRLFEAVSVGAPPPSALRRVLVGGGSLAPGLAARAEALFGAEVFNTYGSNETGSIAHHRPSLTPELPGCVGRIYDDLEVRFLDEAGQPGATEGELSLRPPSDGMPTEYPSGAPLCDSDGWVATGDLGRIMPDGTFVLLGRKSEFLNIGGAKRAPSLFENLLRGYPGLVDIAAFRAPQGDGMDHVGLALVTAPGFDAAAFHKFAADRLGPLFPFAIRLVDQLPATDAGKVDRKRLTAEFDGQTERIPI
jgi:acyl-coenzyme A synthetase/AMP-(fatty) acid ligase